MTLVPHEFSGACTEGTLWGQVAEVASEDRTSGQTQGARTEPGPKLGGTWEDEKARIVPKEKMGCSADSGSSKRHLFNVR